MVDVQTFPISQPVTGVWVRTPRTVPGYFGRRRKNYLFVFCNRSIFLAAVLNN